ncbi:myosin light chain kinase [Mactra antiquata]
MGGSRSRSIDEGSGIVEFHVDPNTKRLVNTALNQHDKEAAPEFVLKPKRQFVNENESAKFKASFEGIESTSLTWSFQGKQLCDGDKYKIYKDKDIYILEIPKVIEDDQGTYTCKIENIGGSDTTDTELEVFVRPKSQTDKSSMFLSPTVDVSLEDTEFVDKQRDATLVCKFHNAIDGKASWYKDGREVGSWQAKQKFDGRTASITLRDATKRACGVYECIVRNTGGEAKTSCQVSLLDSNTKPVPPKFTLSLNDQTVETGDKLVLETEVTGKPRPSLKWFKDNEELGSSQDIRMEFKEGKGRLIMDNLDLVEGSKFTCVAKNIAGEDETVANVNISGSTELREPPIFTRELQDIQANDGDRVEMSVEVKEGLRSELLKQTK